MVHALLPCWEMRQSSKVRAGLIRSSFAIRKESPMSGWKMRWPALFGKYWRVKLAVYWPFCPVRERSNVPYVSLRRARPPMLFLHRSTEPWMAEIRTEPSSLRHKDIVRWFSQPQLPKLRSPLMACVWLLIAVLRACLNSNHLLALPDWKQSVPRERRLINARAGPGEQSLALQFGCGI